MLGAEKQLYNAYRHVKSLKSPLKVHHQIQLSTKIWYIYFLSSGQASLQAEPYFGLLACPK